MDKYKKAFIFSLTDDSEKPYIRAFEEYQKDPVAAIKKYPHWKERFIKDSSELM